MRTYELLRLTKTNLEVFAFRRSYRDAVVPAFREMFACPMLRRLWQMVFLQSDTTFDFFETGERRCNCRASRDDIYVSMRTCMLIFAFLAQLVSRIIDCRHFNCHVKCAYERKEPRAQLMNVMTKRKGTRLNMLTINPRAFGIEKDLRLSFQKYF